MRSCCGRKAEGGARICGQTEVMPRGERPYADIPAHAISVKREDARRRGLALTSAAGTGGRFRPARSGVGLRQRAAGTSVDVGCLKHGSPPTGTSGRTKPSRVSNWPSSAAARTTTLRRTPARSRGGRRRCSHRPIANRSAILPGAAGGTRCRLARRRRSELGEAVVPPAPRLASHSCRCGRTRPRSRPRRDGPRSAPTARADQLHLSGCVGMSKTPPDRYRLAAR